MKSMKKKLIACLLTLGVAGSLAGCGGSVSLSPTIPELKQQGQSKKQYWEQFYTLDVKEMLNLSNYTEITLTEFEYEKKWLSYPVKIKLYDSLISEYPLSSAKMLEKFYISPDKKNIIYQVAAGLEFQNQDYQGKNFLYTNHILVINTDAQLIAEIAIGSLPMAFTKEQLIKHMENMPPLGLVKIYIFSDTWKKLFTDMIDTLSQQNKVAETIEKLRAYKAKETADRMRVEYFFQGRKVPPGNFILNIPGTGKSFKFDFKIDKKYETLAQYCYFTPLFWGICTQKLPSMFYDEFYPKVLPFLSHFNNNIANAIKMLYTKNNFIISFTSDQVDKLIETSIFLPEKSRPEESKTEELSNWTKLNIQYLHKYLRFPDSYDRQKNNIKMFKAQNMQKIVNFVLNQDKSFLERVSIKTKPWGYIQLENSTEKIVTYKHTIELQ